MKGRIGFLLVKALYSHLEDNVTALKALVTAHEQHQQDLRDDEVRISNQLQSEQAKLEALLIQLTSLEHVMEDQSADKTR